VEFEAPEDRPLRTDLRVGRALQHVLEQEEDADHQRDKGDSQPGQQDRYVEGHEGMKARTVCDCNSMQLTVDVLSELARNTLDRRNIIDASIHDPTQTTKARE